MARARIMVVEDESIIAMDIKRMLEAQGYDVPATASSGEQAVARAEQTRPDLILMDIILKGDMDGIDAAEQIHGRFDIPIIYLTAYADETTLSRARATEPFGYLIKPFEERELKSTIEMALYKSAMDRKLKESRQWLITTMNSIGEGLIATDIAGRITLLNPVAGRLTGWNRNEAVGTDVSEVCRISSASGCAADGHPVLRVLHSGADMILPDGSVLVTGAGERIPIDGHADPIVAEDGSITGVIFAFRDITERRRAEEELRQYREHLEELVRDRTLELQKANEQLQKLLQYIEAVERKSAEESLDEHRMTQPYCGDTGIITADANGEIVLINPAAEQLTGFTCEEASGQLLESIFTIVDERTGEPCEVIRGINPETLRALLVDRDGKKRLIMVSNEPVRDENGGIIGMIIEFHRI